MVPSLSRPKKGCKPVECRKNSKRYSSLSCRRTRPSMYLYFCSRFQISSLIHITFDIHPLIAVTSVSEWLISVLYFHFSPIFWTNIFLLAKQVLSCKIGVLKLWHNLLYRFIIVEGEFRSSSGYRIFRTLRARLSEHIMVQSRVLGYFYNRQRD